PDFRRLSGLKGRWNIPKVNVHIFRQGALRLSRVTRLDLGNGRYVLDPSGRDVALFRPGLRGDPQNWRPVREWEIAAPIPCRLLNDASFILPLLARSAPGAMTAAPDWPATMSRCSTLDRRTATATICRRVRRPASLCRSTASTNSPTARPTSPTPRLPTTSGRSTS